MLLYSSLLCLENSGVILHSLCNIMIVLENQRSQLKSKPRMKNHLYIAFAIYFSENNKPSHSTRLYFVAKKKENYDNLNIGFHNINYGLGFSSFPLSSTISIYSVFCILCRSKRVERLSFIYR